MLQKILNLFRRKKKIVFDERDNYVHDPLLYEKNGLVGTSPLRFPQPKSPSFNGLTIDALERTVIEYSNPDFDSEPAYPFPSDSGPDWPSTDSSPDSSSSDSSSFGGGSGDGGGATGEY